MLNAWTIVSGVILASVQLVNDSAFDVDAFVADRIGEAIGRKLAAECITGSGSSALLGILTALSARGVQSGMKGGVYQLGVATTVPIFSNYSSPSVTEIVGNVLHPLSVIGAISKIDPVYLPNCKFFLNPTLAWNMRTVTDGNGRPLIELARGLNADDVMNPNYNNASPIGTLFGFPCVLDANIPVLTANTASGMIFGDLNRAMVLRLVRGDARVDISHPNTIRMDQRYMDYLQLGYLGYVRADARSNDLRAAVCIKPAAT